MEDTQNVVPPVEETVVPAPEVVEETPAPATENVDHVVSQEDLDANPDLVTEGVKVGDTIQLPVLTNPEDIAKAEAEHEASLNGPIVSNETTPDATLVYKDKKVVSVGTETVNDVVYQRLSLEDATTVLLTEDEYRKEVSVA